MRDARWSAFGGCSDPLLQGRIQGVEIGVGDPVEDLGHMAVDGDIVHEVEWLLTTPLLELCIHRLVDIQRWLTHMQEMRSKTMLEDGHVVELMDVLPMQIVVVAEQEDAMALLLPFIDQSETLGRNTAMHGVPCGDDLLAGCVLRCILQNSRNELVGRDKALLVLLHQTVLKALPTGGQAQNILHNSRTQHSLETLNTLGHVVLHEHTAHI